MKLVIATTALICCSDIISAFTLPSSSTFVGRGATTSFGTKASTRTALFAGPEEEEGDGLDLNLEEMFDMFDAADKEEDFDDAIKDVKKGKED